MDSWLHRSAWLQLFDATSSLVKLLERQLLLQLHKVTGLLPLWCRDAVTWRCVWPGWTPPCSPRWAGSSAAALGTSDWRTLDTATSLWYRVTLWTTAGLFEPRRVSNTSQQENSHIKSSLFCPTKLVNMDNGRKRVLEGRFSTGGTTTFSLAARVCLYVLYYMIFY